MDDSFKQEKFIDFLSRGRSFKEIEEKFHLSREEIEKILAQKIEGYRLIKRIGNSGEILFILLPEDPHEIKKPKEKIWTYQLQSDGDPYIVVRFPNELKWKKIKVVPISGVLFGSPDHDAELFDEYINWIARSHYVFIFFNGDIFFEIAEDPIDIINRFERKISRVAHKILWMQQGDLETKGIWRKKQLDPLDIISRDFTIPYFDRPVYADILWKGHIFDFFCFHGVTAARRKGEILNAALQPLEFQEFVMFTVMSHAPDSLSDEPVRECRDPVHFDLKERQQRVIVCPSFKKYFGSKEAKKGQAPPSRGTVSCELFPDGDYHISV